jgi:hypothetical protein
MNEKVYELLEQFKLHECLWNVSCPDYHKRDLRDKALKHVILEAKLEISSKELQKTLTAYRSNWTKEYRKVQASKRSGAGEADVYVPKLWYYAQLEFLKDQVDARPSTNSLVTTQVNETNQQVRTIYYFHLFCHGKTYISLK